MIDKLSRRLREEDLPTVARSCDSRSAVDVDADVTLVGQGRLAGVDSDASTDRALDRERSLRVDRGREGVGRLLKGDEEGVALRVDLDTAMALERCSQ